MHGLGFEYVYNRERHYQVVIVSDLHQQLPQLSLPGSEAHERHYQVVIIVPQISLPGSDGYAHHLVFTEHHLVFTEMYINRSGI